MFERKEQKRISIWLCVEQISLVTIKLKAILVKFTITKLRMINRPLVQHSKEFPISTNFRKSTQLAQSIWRSLIFDKLWPRCHKIRRCYTYDNPVLTRGGEISLEMFDIKRPTVEWKIMNCKIHASDSGSDVPSIIGKICYWGVLKRGKIWEIKIGELELFAICKVFAILYVWKL